MKAILYGIGEYFETHRYLLPEDLEIVAYGDSAKEKSTKRTGKLLNGKPVVSPADFF